MPSHAEAIGLEAELAHQPHAELLPDLVTLRGRKDATIARVRRRLPELGWEG